MEMFFDKKEGKKKNVRDYSKFFPTFNDELDRNLGGGIRTKSLGLIVGDMGAGKSVWCQQIAYGALRASKTVTFISSEMTAKDLIDNMISLSWKKAPDFFLKGNLDIIPVVSQAGKIIRTPDVLVKLISLVSNCRTEIIIIDSLTYFVGQPFDENQVILLFEILKQISLMGKTIFVSVPTYYPELRDFLELKVMNICDLILELTIKDEDGETYRVGKLLKWSAEDEITPSLVYIVDRAFGIAVSVVSSA
ncbi:MAG: ATPase domain-containing protein [Promethearchaeota archaeon]